MRGVLRLAGLVALALPVLGAAPQRGFNLQAPGDTSLPVPPVPPRGAAAGRYSPAPTPNRDIDAPSPGAASTSPSLAPSLFTRGDPYRGDGFNKGSTAQTEQDKRARPGAGFNLRMPLSPN